MRRAEILQEIRRMRFEELYYGWHEGRLSQEEGGYWGYAAGRFVGRYAGMKRMGWKV